MAENIEQVNAPITPTPAKNKPGKIASLVNQFLPKPPIILSRE